MKKQKQLYNKMNGVNANNKSINELLGNISRDTKNISDGVNNKLNMVKIFLAIVSTLALFPVVYFGILLHPDIKLGLDSFVSFINNALFLVLLPCVYLFFYNLSDGKIVFRRKKNVR